MSVTGTPDAFNHNMHFHDGSTCHGSLNLEDGLKQLTAYGAGHRLLERKDTLEVSGKLFTCYSVISCDFEHWAKYGKYVATAEVVIRVNTTEAP